MYTQLNPVTGQATGVYVPDQSDVSASFFAPTPVGGGVSAADAAFRLTVGGVVAPTAPSPEVVPQLFGYFANSYR
jgi:hypothetical protein